MPLPCGRREAEQLAAAVIQDIEPFSQTSSEHPRTVKDLVLIRENFKTSFTEMVVSPGESEVNYLIYVQEKYFKVLSYTLAIGSKESKKL